MELPDQKQLFAAYPERREEMSFPLEGEHRQYTLKIIIEGISREMILNR